MPWVSMPVPSVGNENPLNKLGNQPTVRLYALGILLANAVITAFRGSLRLFDFEIGVAIELVFVEALDGLSLRQ
jgi:hypothetical protein